MVDGLARMDYLWKSNQSPNPAMNPVETPLMKQYYQIKSKHPDAILLFRVGDFYETFSDDAVRAAGILGITLTKRANGSASFVELAGFPYHALDTYLPKLVRAGQRVAICEQLEDPKATKTLVKRGVTELVTPGVALGDSVLEHRENNFLACLRFDKKGAGLALLDLSTGEFFAGQGSHLQIDKTLSSFAPKEVLHEKSKKEEYRERFGDRYYSFALEDWAFSPNTAHDRLIRQFGTHSLKGFGIEGLELATTAAGAILHYLDLTEHHHTSHLRGIARLDQDQHVWLDKFSQRNLELLEAQHGRASSLLGVLDRTHSPMGARLMRRWVALPLIDTQAIARRLDAVETLSREASARQRLAELVGSMGDLERVCAKVASQRATPRDLWQMLLALRALPPIQEACLALPDELLRQAAMQIDPCDEARLRLERELRPEPPNAVQKGGVIATGVSAELDELRSLAGSGKDYLAQLQKRMAEQTGISSLKIGFNNVFGYYFEVRNTHKDRVPAQWVRKQTLVGAERYIDQELKEYETKILGAEGRILDLETQLFNALVLGLAEQLEALQRDAQVAGQIDCLCSLAEVAQQNNYAKPLVDNEFRIDIKGGRHPVIERNLPVGQEYVANDVLLDQDQQIAIITGPNMAGKSALLRQTALIVLMAQMGSFVPAASASIGYVDKVFTRVGASDNLSQGESTFMVEMNEAASILNNLSARSLVLFDELGRGTSTYDGISIAWAIVEHIHEHPSARAKTLFATHYHELNEMQAQFPRIRNFNVSVREVENKVIFLRKLVPGGSEHSFGIHVAQMAGMPPSVVRRADEILAELEKSREGQELSKPVKGLAQQREGYQLSFFQLEDPVLKQVRDHIRKLDLDNLTPLQALNVLSEIKKSVNLK